MEVIFLKVAEAELEQAIHYYESEQCSLGLRFKLEVQRTLQRIVEYPMVYQPLRCLIARFPYAIIYQYKQSSTEILVVAIAHLHRKPDYWLSRNN